MAWDGVIAALQVSDAVAVAALAAEVPGISDLVEGLRGLEESDVGGPAWARLSAALQRKLLASPTALRPLGATPLELGVDRAGWSLLHFAAKAGRRRSVHLLLALGAEPRRRNSLGQQAKHLVPSGGTCGRALAAAEAALGRAEALRRAGGGAPAFLLADTRGVLDLSSASAPAPSLAPSVAASLVSPLSVEAAFAGLEDAFQDDAGGCEKEAADGGGGSVPGRTQLATTGNAAEVAATPADVSDAPPDAFWGGERAAAATARALRRAREARAAAEAAVAEQKRRLAALDHAARKLTAAAARRASRASLLGDVWAERRWASEAADAAFPADQARARLALARAEADLGEARAAALRVATRAAAARAARDAASGDVQLAEGRRRSTSSGSGRGDGGGRSNGGGGGLASAQKAYAAAWLAHGEASEAARREPPPPPPAHLVATRGKAEDWVRR